MNKTVGSTLLVAGTMIGAGMLAMPLTSAGIGLTATVFLLIGLWAVLTFTALLFVELYQTADSDAGIGTLAAQYFGKAGRIISTAVLIVFLYALIAAYVSGGGSLLMDLLPAMGDKDTMNKIAVLVFTIFFGSFIVIGTHSVDKINRVLFFVMIATFILVLALMLPNIKFDNLMAMPIDNALIISASPVFFTAFGFHGSIPSLNKYLDGNVKSLRIAILVGSGITLFAYFLWQLSTHGLLSQNEFLQILREDATLNGLVKATLEITQSPIIANAVKIFSTLALVTSFLGVALGLLECIEDLLKQSFDIHAGRISLGLMTFIPPVLFSLFYPEGFILALGYAGQMFAFYAVVLPVALVWKARSIHPNLPYRVWGGKALLVLVLVLGVIITSIPFAIRAGYLPFVVG
ncbi:MAG: aromatic amino acid transporter [Haemophilus parainfluenzae]|uniref:Aromatic amino acid permease n=1 Tax=Haemophilus parainfluenzae ATCC 33392 TaxID=888828 RepID=A0ABD7ZL67_HAEPA|nr:aromatic amino acid transporter [Haemophilus parainfluenzae]EGC71631.1 putative toxin-antitoxin system toxin component, PIN family [Haemophilus parainfluenzae ATCC 33392]KFL99035.1 aromatic amino acid transport protein [Haemophilus parainfluenzae ATCC 33392]MBF1226428.1 amino acid permease [Haemophilus parainfluenzae]QQB22601.1 amino acid permease [Haemophilus parainfluenzae]WMS24252.1 aromatic amino acid transporter [Haemophilus parainfluenzae ATCC 33392]